MLFRMFLFFSNYSLFYYKPVSLYYILLLMIIQPSSLQISTYSSLKDKSADSPAYRKALAIYESILESTRDIPNFQQNYANNDSNFALFIFGSAFKLILKSNQEMLYNIDGMLLLINMMIQKVNIGAIKTNGILSELQKCVYGILKNGQGQQKTPLMIRLAISILSYTLVNSDKIQNDKQAIQILHTMFNLSVQSHRTNILSKQSSKMLCHLAKSNPSFSRVLARHATMSMLGNIESNLYLNNIREVIAQFPVQLINDIAYRSCKHLSNVQCTNQDEETFLAQSYYFLEKLGQKFSSETLEQICKELINNLPISAKTQSKVVFCYVQTLHSIFQQLIITNQKTGNKYFSSVLSILQQYLTKGGRIQKQIVGVIRSILTTCVKKSMWVNQTNDDFDLLGIQDIGLEEKKGNSFTKLITMLEGMLSDQYPNHKATASFLQAFFQNLDKTAFDLVIGLIDKIVNFREKFDDKSFKKVMQAIFGAVSIENLCQVYKIGVSGDISDPNFQSHNNLWLVYCTEKFDGTEQFSSFMNYYYPLLLDLKNIISTSKISPVRVQAYKNLVEMIWRCLKVFCKNPSPLYEYQAFIETIRKQIPEANDSTLDHISMGLESLCSALAAQQYESKWAGNLISLLAKTLDIEKNNSKQILRAIKHLSVIADKQYLVRVFDKNIVKLIQQKQKGTLTSKDMGTNIKNLQILIAVSKGINFYDPTVVAPYRISREQLVIKLLQLLIVQNSIFQKKAYKYIFQTLGLMGQSYLNQVIQLLEQNEHKIMPASKHYRLAILMHLWQRLSKNDNKLTEAFEFMKKYLPQILLDIRQSNQRARRQAVALFQSFCKKIVEQELLESFIEIMCAGLAVESSQTKVSTLNGLTEIFNKKYSIDMEFAVGILEIVLMVLYEQKSEIYKSVIDFSRRFILFSEKTKQIDHILSTILEQLFKADLNSKMQNRSVLKHLLIKLSKKFGREKIEKLIPSEDRKILANALKVENREKRKKRERLIQKRKEFQERMRNQQKSSSQDSDDENQVEGELENMEMEDENNEELKALQNPDNLLLKYDLEKQNFHFEEDKFNLKSKAKKEQRKKEEDAITFQNGLMVVKDDGKRRRQNRGDDDQEGEGQQVNKQQNQQLNSRKRRKLNDIHEIKESGATFRSNRAGGDLQLKDKPQPYAFIQFNSKALNKRFKKRAEKAFDTIFERKQGGLKGLKARIAHRNN